MDAIDLEEAAVDRSISVIRTLCPDAKLGLGHRYCPGGRPLGFWKPPVVFE